MSDNNRKKNAIHISFPCRLRTCLHHSLFLALNARVIVLLFLTLHMVHEAQCLLSPQYVVEIHLKSINTVHLHSSQHKYGQLTEQGSNEGSCTGRGGTTLQAGKLPLNSNRVRRKVSVNSFQQQCRGDVGEELLGYIYLGSGRVRTELVGSTSPNFCFYEKMC